MRKERILLPDDVECKELRELIVKGIKLLALMAAFLISAALVASLIGQNPDLVLTRLILVAFCFREVFRK